MPYDPNFPPYKAKLISAQWRDQFHGLKDLDDAQAEQVASLQTQSSAQQATIAEQAGQISVLEARLSATQANVSDYQMQLATVMAQVDVLQARVDALSPP